MSKEDELIGFKFWIDSQEKDTVHFEVTAALEHNHYYCEPIENKGESIGQVMSLSEIEDYKLLNEMFH